MTDLKKHANNISTTLNGAITNVQTTITVTSDTGLPSISGSEYYALTITDGTNIEIVHVTDDTSTPTLTVTRGQEGTSGTAFADGDLVQLRVTADDVDRKTDATSDWTVSGTWTVSSDWSITGDWTFQNSLTQVELTINGLTSIDQSTSIGTLYTANGMNTTSKYTAPVLFGSTDPDFTTSNPKILAGITGVAIQTYGSDTAGGMGVAFLGSKTSPGASPTLEEMGRIVSGSSYVDLQIQGSSNGPGGLVLFEDTDNGTSQVRLAAPSNITSSYTLLLPSAQTANSDGFITWDTSGNATWRDYEEGSWTPTFDFATTGDLSVVYTQQAGSYTQIGNRVILQFVLQCTPTYTTGTGQIRIGGLPITVGQGASGQIYDKSAAITYPASRTHVSLFAISATTYLTIRSLGSGVADTNLTDTNIASGSAFDIAGTFIYRT